MRFGGGKTMRAQFDHLCAVPEGKHVAVRVILFRAGVFPGAGHALLYAEGPAGQLDGNAYTAVNGQEDHYLTDSAEALRTPIADIKAGKAGHLL